MCNEVLSLSPSLSLSHTHTHTYTHTHTHIFTKGVGAETEIESTDRDKQTDRQRHGLSITVRIKGTIRSWTCGLQSSKERLYLDSSVRVLVLSLSLCPFVCRVCSLPFRSLPVTTCPNMSAFEPQSCLPRLCLQSSEKSLYLKSQSDVRR